ncbi:MAG: hypothetical protein HQK72_09385 [Desulfamplus sp.]|nr:hypothetical protein [Desulfamplus sp.]
MTADDVSINNLISSSESISQLTDIVGKDGLKRIISVFGGDTIYILMSESVIKKERDISI